MSASKSEADEEIVELNMPRPRSISRKPEDRTRESPGDESTTPKRNRRESDAVQMQKESVAADHEALSNLTREVHSAANVPALEDAPETLEEEATQESESASRQEPTQQPKQVRTDSETIPSGINMLDMENDEATPDQEFRSQSIRLDPDSTIRQADPAAHMSAMPAFSMGIGQQESRDTATMAQNRFGATLGEENLSASMGNPTNDHQYHFHRGSRGISPPPGFEDSTIPSYQDSSEIPSYQNVVSQPPGLPVPPPALSSDLMSILPESERPAMTDKFMNAHIARHGTSSLSPLALLAPDHADTLPEYVLTGTAFDDSGVNRGRNRQERFILNSEEAREVAKVEAELIAVRKIEEQEALEAIQAMEGLASEMPFDLDQLAAIHASGDSPSDYYSSDEMAQFQRLASEPGDVENDEMTTNDHESELLQMMAQYVRRSPTMEDDTMGDEPDIDELENMLRDRLITQNARSPQYVEPQFNEAHGPNSAVMTSTESEVREILQKVAQIAPPNTGDENISPAQNNFSSATSRSGVDVEALRDAAIERKEHNSDELTTQEVSSAHAGAGYGGGHGVKRINLDADAYAAQQARNAKKADLYIDLSHQINLLRQAEDYSRDSFDLTTKLLMINPEYYTIWNYRREIMLNGLFVESDEMGKQELLNTELKRLQGILQDYPKVYWIWNHRKWCLSQCPWPDWSRELLLVTKMLEQDARNFHVWEYRRYVVSQIERAEESSKAEREFEYTTAAINSNFSNFSAWHNRTKLVPKLLNNIDDEAERNARRQEILLTELELIKGAIYTDPDDQSVWLYHRWLLNPDSAHQDLHPLAPTTTEEHVGHLTNELQMIDELMEEEPDNIWCTYAKVHYALSLQRLTEEPHSPEQSAKLKNLMTVLENTDTLREGRYRDWHKSVFSVPVSQPSKVSEDVRSQFTIFNDLKAKPEWSDLALHGDGRITGIHTTSKATPCVVIAGWQSMQDFTETHPDASIVVANIRNGGGIDYSQISKLE
ncbi:Rab geranylgeranyltransferase alpha subunit5 / FY16936)) [Taphrina deformans PYCC 5710]|uniref:Geranylgeranyl transferase type-2 subunit alpha n=1 Tax=Taphrina deformans (strain PYCC 5710 / ATCC 11124 / CBS 356.35 / IMI 108563 / JCM 9778 / NBRC 8474) TaxID=1097556 RepID=R4XAK8_TAPDE|nr:Rab geranylgeranyltransferase alpha subunit5 / FY16936)) [Taphrina deformans PYCC 5710]|eukprot:CCG81338.1 Rab geranylgeranyltransferase alpha subunit5 / FY16936)) [Taphrina deformans PYCC 5710]